MLWPAIGGGLGLVIGSFIALVTWRWPQGLAVTGRSRCDGCGQQLGAAELVPILSFLVQRGRCGRCGGAIAGRHLAIELAAGLIGAGLFWRHPPLAAAA
uniref:prepilin peptidase n=1 Tax=Sandarakinorhabdus rubra TaxID=2672568 RepID=UPI0013DC306A